MKAAAPRGAGASPLPSPGDTSACVLGPCLARLYCHGYGEDPKAAHADGISVGNDLYYSLQSLAVYTVAG